MIAAGSLFTSCVENTEPQGIKDIRQAKADYIESLSKLNAATEALVAAEAAYKNAETAVKNAEVAVVEAQAAQAQALAAQEQARVEIIKAQAEAAKIANEKAVAALNHQLALDSLALVEKLIEIAQSEQINALFIEAQKAELAKQLAMDSARIMQMFLEIAEQEAQNAYNAELRKADLEEYKARVEKNIKGYEADIARYEADIRDAQDRIAKAEAQAQKDALDLEKELVQKKAALLAAQHALEQQEAAYLAFLAEVELRSYQLSPAEKSAVKEYKDAYTAVIAAKQKVRKVEELVFENDTEIEKKYADSLATLQNKVTGAKVAIEFYTAQIADVEARLANLPDSGKTAEEVAALEAEYKEQLKNLEYDLANVKNEYLTYKKTQLGEPVIAYATELGEWVAKNATLPAPFNMHFKAELPDNGAVSSLFKTSVENFYKEQETKPVEVENGYIVANFKTSTAALDGVYVLDSIIDALSRKYIIDRVGIAGNDTVGLAAAVKAEQEKYDAIADTLTDGLGKYKPFVDAQDSVKKAIEDTVKAVDAYEKAYTADTAAISVLKKARKAANDAKDSVDKFKGIWETAKTDSTKAGKTYSDSVANHKEKHDAYTKLQAELDSLQDVYDHLTEWQAAAAGAVASTKILRDTAESVLTRAENDSSEAYAAAKGAYGTPEFAKLDSISKEKNKIVAEARKDFKAKDKAYNDAVALEGELSKKDKETIGQEIANKKPAVKDAKTADSTAAKQEERAAVRLAEAAKAYKKASNDTATWFNAYEKAEEERVLARKDKLHKDTVLTLAQEYKTAAFEYFYNAEGVLVPVAKDKFYVLYSKFWGVTLTDASFNDAGFLNDSIKIAPKEFVDIFIKDGGNDIVKFNPNYGYDHTKDPKFTGAFTLDENNEIKIILDQLKEYGVTAFGETLLCDLFAKQQCAETIFAAVGTVDNDEALAALTKIKEDLADAFVDAGKKQEENSQPFFKFVQDLVGEDFLNSVFARIDKAIAKYSEFIDEEITPSYNSIIAKAIAQGKTTSKQVFTYWFEYICCNVYVGEKYENLQIADAFAGEEIRQLISDIFAAKIENKDKYKVAKDRDNSFENLLFAAVDLTDAEYPDITGKFIDLVFDPTVMSYIVKDFGGKIAELQEKHFAEWRAEWTAYQEKLTAVQTKIDAIKALQGVLGGYTKDSTIKDLITKENISNGYIGWMKGQLDIFEFVLVEAQKALDAFVAGPDIYEQHKIEHLADVLAKAQNDLAVAEKRLEVATAAYNKVLESHSIAE